MKNDKLSISTQVQEYWDAFCSSKYKLSACEEHKLNGKQYGVALLDSLWRQNVDGHFHVLATEDIEQLIDLISENYQLHHDEFTLPEALSVHRGPSKLAVTNIVCTLASSILNSNIKMVQSEITFENQHQILGDSLSKKLQSALQQILDQAQASELVANEDEVMDNAVMILYMNRLVFFSYF